MKKNKKRRTQFMAGLLVLLITASTIAGSLITAFADETKIVTLGADLSDEQRELILNYFNTSEDEAEVVEITNDDEHHYLDDIATPQQIGSHTYSCTYIEPTNEGGIHIKTVNLTWVTCEMIRNALITSGITNCNVICAAPKEVSGTGALTGIFKAYETATEEKLEEEKVELASEELVTTMQLSEVIGQEEATNMVGELKESVIVDNLESEDDIVKILDDYIVKYNVNITFEQRQALLDLLTAISKQNYNAEDVENAYKDIRDTVQSIKDTTEETKNIVEKFVDWFKTAWEKLTGQYEKNIASEEAKAVKKQLGILANTNDDLLGSKTVVTVTEEDGLLEQAEEAKEEENNTEEDKGFFDKIAGFFKNLFGGNDEKEANSTENAEESTETESKPTLTFDSVEGAKDSSEESTEETESTESTESTEEGTDEKSGILDKVNWEMQNEQTDTTSDKSGTPSLDDITN